MSWTNRTKPSTSWANRSKPTIGDYMLAEDGGLILSENGSFIILEQSETSTGTDWTNRTSVSTSWTNRVIP